MKLFHIDPFVAASEKLGSPRWPSVGHLLEPSYEEIDPEDNPGMGQIWWDG